MGARKRVAKDRAAYESATKKQKATELMVPKHPKTGKPMRAAKKPVTLKTKKPVVEAAKNLKMHAKHTKDQEKNHALVVKAQASCKKIAADGERTCKNASAAAAAKVKPDTKEHKKALKVGAECIESVDAALKRCLAAAGGSYLAMGAATLAITAAMLF